MIDYEKVLLFCEKHQLSFEEFMLLYTLHIKSGNYVEHLHSNMSEYYSNKKTNYVEMAKDLETRGFLVILKHISPKIIRIKDLQITEKFVNLLFVDPDEIWKKFIERYPDKGYSPTGATQFGARIVKENDKEYFLHNILKNADKHRAEKILTSLEEMFDFDGEAPTRPAQYGISRFIRNWDVLLKQHEENSESRGGNWHVQVI